ncbi:MAG: hypothetical protein R2860_08970 [Desulfobacterales bacterium]
MQLESHQFVHESHGCIVNQREIGVHTEVSSAALRGLAERTVRILVGEMRDLKPCLWPLKPLPRSHLMLPRPAYLQRHEDR